MAKLPAQSVDAIITDPPYGTTACSWDTIIPFEPMWAAIKRVIKPRGAVVLFGSEPFSSMLRASNLDWYKYDWYQKKERGTGFITTDKRPMMMIDCVSIFYKSQPTYNPQLEILKKPYSHILPAKKGQYQNDEQLKNGRIYKTYTHRTPTQLISFARITKKSIHPTQKPVALMAYLVKTYTNPGDTILDFALGSGSTGIAAVQNGRHFIGIDNGHCEKEGHYYGWRWVDVARERIANAAGDFMQTEKEKATGQMSLFD